LLSFQNITHSFDEKPLFKDVGYSLNDGSLLVVKGHNGSGKTTLLKILAGLITPKYGFRYFGDFEISEDYQKYFSNINYIGHKNAIEEDFTIKENLDFYASLTDSKTATPAIVKYFSLEENLNDVCATLSAGWKRRVALTRLMMIRRKIWIIDEPFANLDEDIIDMTLKMIASFCDQGGICIISCHQEVKLPFGAHLYLEDFKA
jgi:heme exporter protein A